MYGDSPFARDHYLFLSNMPIDDIHIAKKATSMQQSSQWGMHAFQSLFPCKKDHTALEYRGQQKLAMKLLILLYNLHARKVAVNQILMYTCPLSMRM